MRKPFNLVNHIFEKHHFGAFSVFHTNYLVILGEKKIQIEICMLYHRKILTREVRSNKRFIYTQSGVRFWFRPHFGKMIAAPPGYGTFRAKIVSKTYSKFQREFVDSFFPLKLGVKEKCQLLSSLWDMEQNDSLNL